MEDDEIELIRDTSPIEINFPASTYDDGSDGASQPHIAEENHAQSIPPRPRVRRGWLDIKRGLTGDPLMVKREKQVAWVVTVTVLGVTAFLLFAVPLLVDTSLVHEDCRDFEELSFGEEYKKFPYIFSKGKFELCRKGQSVLIGTLGTKHTYLSEVKVDLYAYTNETLLNVTRLSENCLRIEWVGMSSRQTPLTDCFELGEDALWFAAYEVINQTWTINNASFPRTSFVPKDFLSPLETQPHVFGPVLHPLWLTSRGVGIHVDPHVQLYVSMKDKHLCLHALPFELECAPGATNQTMFNYTVCVFNTVAMTAQHILAKSGHIPHPSKQPSETVFRYPIWSTANLVTLSDDSLESFYSNITANSFNVSMLHLETGYSPNEGDLLLDTSRITPSKLLQLSQHVKLSAWVHPFVDYNADNFSQDISQDFYLPSLSEIEGNSVSLVRWWRGYGAVVNFLSDTVRQKQAARFADFVQTNHLTSLSFDGGEYTYLPKCVYTENLVHPADYVQAYVRMVGSTSYSTFASVRVGYFTQDQPIFVRLLDRNFTWGENNGLRSVLNAVISLGLGGYPFIIPNKVGGIVKQVESDEDRDLYLRWVQLHAFLPVMEFAYPPWMSRNETVLGVVKDMTTLHNQLVMEESFQNALSNGTTHGYPIIRPLWWLADQEGIADPDLFMISDQFLIGDNIMAAPILQEKTVQREVYFPKLTSWVVKRPKKLLSVCAATGNSHPCANGKRLNFSVPLTETLYFHRVYV